MKFRKILDEINPYVPGKSTEEIQNKYNIESIIKLASNENPYGCSKEVQKCFTNIDIEIYPDNDCSKLRKLLSKKYNIEEDELIFGGGSVEIISMIAQILIEQNDEVITCTPSFSSYYSATKLMNGKLIEVQLKDNVFDLQGIKNKITDRTKLIYIANPNNPTGTIITEDEQRNFIEGIPQNIMVVLDEAYYEFVTDKNYPESINFLKQHDNIIILRTFSKAYGLAGLRIGYGVASKKIIEQLNKVRNPFNVSTLAQDAAHMALSDVDFLKMVVNNNNQVLEYMYKELDKLNISYISSQANFIMINVKTSGAKFAEKLLERGFIVRPGFPLMDSYIRVSIGTIEQMRQFIKVLAILINEERD